MKIEKQIEKAVKLASHLKDANKRTVNKVKKALSYMREKYGDAVLADAGLEPSDFPLYRTEVMRYGVLGTPVSTGFSISEEMRAAHEYFNRLVVVTKPLLQRWFDTIDGPEQQAVRKLSDEIEKCYASIREINSEEYRGKGGPKSKADRKTDRETRIEKLRSEINALKLERKPLFATAATERSAMLKQHEAKCKEIDKEISEARKSVRCSFANTKGEDKLWFGNYLRVEEEHKQAVNACKGAFGRFPHFRYEDFQGKPPADFMTWEKWDGEGVITTTLSQNEVPKQVSTVMDGSNPRLRLRMLAQQDLPKFGLPPEFLFQRDSRGTPSIGVRSKKADFLYVVSLRNRDGWMEAVVVLHRPLGASDDRALEASVVTRKIGRRLQRYLIVTVKRMNSMKAQGTAVLSVTPDFEDGVSYASWKLEQSGNLVVSGKESLPVMWNREREKSASLAEIEDFCKHLEILQGSHFRALQSFWKDTFKEELTSRSQAAYLYREFQTKANNPKCFAGARLEARKANERLKTDEKGWSYAEATAGIASVFETGMGLNYEHALRLAALTMFHERHTHLREWAANLRQRAEALRLDTFRKFVAKVGKEHSLAEIRFPDTKYGKRRVEGGQRYASPSLLREVCMNYAKRNHLKWTLFKETPVDIVDISLSVSFDVATLTV